MANMIENEDSQLIRSYQQGNNDSYRLLFRKYYPRVYQMVLTKGISGTDTEDLTSEIFIKLIDALKKFRFEKPFVHFLRRMVRNKLFDYYRKKQLNHYFVALDEVIVFAQPEHLFEINEIIRICLNKIKSLTRRAIFALWIDGYKRHQIAELMQIAIGTVHSNLDRGKDDFKHCIQEKLS